MNFTFIGCSFTVGEGLEFEKNDPNLYANIVSNRYTATVDNLAVKGNSNLNIFKIALNEILFGNADRVFVQWSALNRLWVYPGPNTKLLLLHTINQNYQYRDISYTKKELQYLTDNWRLLNHDYNHILELINYCKILEEVSKNKNQIIFINGLLPWTREIAESSTVADFSLNLSKYTKELLDFDNRSDNELVELFTQLHDNVTAMNTDLWVNRFESMLENIVDFGNDNSHPGTKSHQLYADMIINYLEETNG
jgi:hypothetical protein